MRDGRDVPDVIRSRAEQHHHPPERKLRAHPHFPVLEAQPPGHNARGGHQHDIQPQQLGRSAQRRMDGSDGVEAIAQARRELRPHHPERRPHHQRNHHQVERQHGSLADAVRCKAFSPRQKSSGEQRQAHAELHQQVQVGDKRGPGAEKSLHRSSSTRAQAAAAKRPRRLAPPASRDGPKIHYESWKRIDEMPAGDRRRASRGEADGRPDAQSSWERDARLARNAWSEVYGFSTMSLFIGPSTPSSSFFSFSPTLNLSSAPTRSSTSALKSAVATPMPLCASFIVRPVYLHGPPDASQIWFTRFILSLAISVWAKNALMRVSAATRATNSSTTAVIASFLPSRS